MQGMVKVFSCGVVFFLTVFATSQSLLLAIQSPATDSDSITELRKLLELKNGEIIEDADGKIVAITLNPVHYTSECFGTISTLQSLRSLKISGCTFPSRDLLKKLSQCAKLEEVSFRCVLQEFPAEAWDEIARIKPLRTLRIDSFRDANLGSLPKTLPITKLISINIGKFSRQEFEAISRIETLTEIELSAYELSFADCGVFDDQEYKAVAVQKLSIGEFSKTKK